jgi:hypothetical protein
MHGIGVWEGHIFFNFILISTFNLAVQQETVPASQAKYLALQTQWLRLN